jgi:hypothetical protein
MWIVGGAGFLGSLLAFVLSFVPPSQIAVGSPTAYLGILIVCNIIVVAIPFMILAFRKSTWKSTSPDDAFAPFSWETPRPAKVEPAVEELVHQ